ncbi:condensin complex subunit 2 [Cryptococcus neoformans]|uniref:Condensin complex subunit 2 n=1 Tax=Cryptococcus neoformans (strain H99 / ATCC 208821 / CBS 10515 / FGSC 9487) TaxID=235443 RepID=J9VIC7_CRYN9|nr:condensin complex subunit 2 [Cryptococcus neoformans var. grubii H99]AUB23825.1 condensin complex subunit 2 [Cryptococcus neoformans var. grubii]OWT40338.1 condensin complex subunit 2 [Cryptococcus neoformans var. grubii Bt1]OWZ33320.1 condensin complex subunit 2 [Cryptococcus neoformans var. grubii AD2-60a]OWZ45416.1 condensin complex subunit 2 [Cryptococcus neoformans var. grubii C23]OWZ52799.1 condensin complex subunit 2 [Cryptococcus neoformans var. grubii 125.91]OXC85477.1 condensin c|eukprot:XP_012048433.1 condensin complex subunit 2 [Cryptococcus neoformans var. grubii H99]
MAALHGKRPRMSASAQAIHQQTRINDDVAEKAKRRKSAHFSAVPDNNSISDENVNPKNQAGKRVMSGIAIQKQGLIQKRGKRLSAVEPNMPEVRIEVKENKYEEWMKLATDNKITANNTWSFALIDYFADLTLLRNGPDDQSINFQKASCTLDGCVKIWTSRVDSVATETGKLLSGLAGGSAETGDNDGLEGEEDEVGEPKTTRKTVRSEATLAKSFAQLQIKKFDLEFTVDPLFKKTSADFDEGGAMGLLMNHLSVDNKLREVFDAGDAVADEQDLDEEEEEGDGGMIDEVVQLDKLRNYIPITKFLTEHSINPSLASFHFTSDSSSGNDNDSATILGLKDSFPVDEYNPYDVPMATQDDYNPMDPAFNRGHGEGHDFFGGDDYDAGPAYGDGGFDEDGTSMMGDPEDDLVAPFHNSANSNGGSLALLGPGSSHVGPFDPRRQGQGHEIVLTLGEGDDTGSGGMFEYFDKGFGKSWAGAEHWRLRKVSRKDTATAGTITSTSSKTKADKTPFAIDFHTPLATSLSTSTKALFTPASNKSSITLPSTSAPTKTKNGKSMSGQRRLREERLLPDDMHFSSHQLLRLFLKPQFSLKMRRGGKNMGAMGGMIGADGEIDENFWAAAAKEREGGECVGDEFGSAPAPFESQFFQDDDDYGDMDNDVDFGPIQPSVPVLSGPGEEEDDLWAGTQMELKKVRPENVNFAKKAKRVDVKRLKDDIWTGLKDLVPHADKTGDTDTDDEDPTPSTPPEPSDFEPVKTFSSIIQSLRSTYPPQKMSEISTSFCFICLLHLANEEGLRIESARGDGKEGEDVGCVGVAPMGEDGEIVLGEGLNALMGVLGAGRGGSEGMRSMGEGEKKDRVIGELEALKVYKDHAAGRAA